MSDNPLCEECRELPTHHKCKVCHDRYVCPMCSGKRGYDDLNDIRCDNCGPAVENIAQSATVSRLEYVAIAQLERTHEDNDTIDCTAIESSDSNYSEVNSDMDVEVEIIAEGGDGDDENVDFESKTVVDKPDRMHKKMGMNAAVSVPFKALVPLAPIKEKYPNSYKQNRGKFIVKGIRSYDTGKNDLEKWTVFLLLEWTANQLKPDVDSATVWRANYRSCKMEKPGPPNQFFFPDLKIAHGLISPSKSPKKQIKPSYNPSDVVDPESDIEVEKESASPEENTDPYYVQWDNFFIDGIVIDDRGQINKTSASIQGFREVIPMTDLPKMTLFLMLLPKVYIIDHLIPATDEELMEREYDIIKPGEFDCWLGLWFLMQLHPGYQTKDFFSVKERNMIWNPPFLGGVMSGKRFSRILESIRLRKKHDNPQRRDRFFWVRRLIEGFNYNMTHTFNPSWIVCVDESMVVFSNKYAPGWMVVKRKPHPMGNEYHTNACCQSKVIFWIELVEGKDLPKEGEHSEIEFEKEFKSKVAALVVRMTTPLWGSGRVVIMDSGFGYIPSVVQLRARGLFSTTVIKKHAHWPKYTKAAEAVLEMQGKEVGSIKVRRGFYLNNGESHKLHMVALADSLHTSLMVTNWSTTLRSGEPKKRRVGNDIVQFQYGELHNHYYSGRHAVDDNNNNRQGCLSLEEVFVPKAWEMRQFGFIIALCQTNAFVLYNYFRAKKNLNEVSKAEFVRGLCNELINNEVYSSHKSDEEENSKNIGGKRRKRVEEHVLCKIPARHGKWNGKMFRPMKQSYQKYRCSYGCGSMIRTYCICDKSLMLCNECYSIHKAEHN